jgi:hypothetical protein
MDYEDFDLKVERAERQYRALVQRSPAGEGSATFAPPFSDETLGLLRAKITEAVAENEQRRPDQLKVVLEFARQFGGRLFEAVFQGEVLSLIRTSLSITTSKPNTGLRLRLRLQEVPELADMPWEFLFDAKDREFLAHSIHTPLVRYIEMVHVPQPLAITLPLRILIAVSNPQNYPQLNVDREVEKIDAALRSLKSEDKVRVEWLKSPTMQSLHDILSSDKFHVFHFIGHGSFEIDSTECAIVLENQRGQGQLTDRRRLRALLGEHEHMRLVVLNCCEGARNSRVDPFASVATTLTKRGAPAVVAMQFPISDEAAIAFASEFYDSLSQGRPIDESVARARKSIYLLPNDVEWATPVLYMRSPNGQVFEVEGLESSSDSEEAPGDSAKASEEELASHKSSVSRNFSSIPENPPDPTPIVNSDDPQRGRWGGSSERDGRKIEASLDKDRIRKNVFYFTAVVSSIDDSPLVGPVKFHLHTSYRPHIITIRRVRDNRWASLEDYSAEGVYTIGVQVKGRSGDWTQLELDLAKLRGLPRRFRSR